MKYITVHTVTMIENRIVSNAHYNYFHNDKQLDNFLERHPDEKLVMYKKVKLRSKRNKL